MKLKQVGPDAAIAELPKKLKHENAMKKKLNSLFNKMGDDVKKQIEKTSVAPNLAGFNAEMQGLIENTYDKTSKTFKAGLRNDLGLGSTNSTLINESIDNFISANVPDQTKRIMNTTNRQLSKIINKVIEENAIEGIELSREELSSQVSQKFKQRNRTRSETIATTEVQNIAEESKFIEAQTLADSGKIEAVKRWDAVLDRKTRPFHAVADGQRRPVSTPFIVNGESLMRPGDSSLGASASNIINCRCSVQFITVKVN